MKIERIEIDPVCYPTRGRFKFFEDPQGNRQGRSAVIIKITAENGITGWGESVPIPKWSYETLESVAGTIQNYLTPVLLGRDIFDIEGAHAVMNKTIVQGFTTGMPIAKAGIDIALHDVVCKTLHCSLAQYWGRSAKENLTLSWTLNPVSLDQLEPMIEDGWNKGFRNFNVKVAPDISFDMELCRRVKERVPEGFLWADANGGYDLSTALAAAPKLADIGVSVLEQPLPPNYIAGYRRLRQQGALPIIMDEGVISPHDLLEFIQLDMLDGVAMKPARCGGLLSARRQIEILQDAGMMFLGSGLTDPDISLAATLALYGSYNLSHPAALNGYQFLDHSVITEPLIPQEGTMQIPKGPGLGIDVDPAKINAIMS